MLDFNGVKIEWLNHHAAFRITNSKTVYIDPWEIETFEDADIILITHAHYDHCSPSDIEKIKNADTTIIAPPDCAAKFKNAQAIKPGQTTTAKGIKIEAVPAYNLTRFRSPGTPFHPKDMNWVGFIIEIDGVRIYHAGDTDKIPEMSDIKADICLLPIGGTYTMDAQEATEAANLINPKIAIPMHWGKIVGKKEDAHLFSSKTETEVRILETR